MNTDHRSGKWVTGADGFGPVVSPVQSAPPGPPAQPPAQQLTGRGQLSADGTLDGSHSPAPSHDIQRLTGSRAMSNGPVPPR